jgi:hypothetical protein
MHDTSPRWCTRVVSHDAAAATNVPLPPPAMLEETTFEALYTGTPKRVSPRHITGNS